MCVCKGERRMARKGFSGKKRETSVSLKKVKQAHVAHSTDMMISGSYLPPYRLTGSLSEGQGSREEQPEESGSVG